MKLQILTKQKKNLKKQQLKVQQPVEHHKHKHIKMNAKISTTMSAIWYFMIMQIF